MINKLNKLKNKLKKLNKIFSSQSLYWRKEAASLAPESSPPENIIPTVTVEPEIFNPGPEIPALETLNLKDRSSFITALRHYGDHPSVRGFIGRFLRTHRVTETEFPMELEDALCTLPLPELIRIETVSACNLRCQHCTTGVAYQSTDRRVMKMETFDLLIAQLQQFTTIRTAVLYLGGEPLLNKHHALMCKRIKAETTIQKTKFVTNGMLITEEWCEKLADADVDSISISLDGISADEHDMIRTRSNYETIKKNIWMLKTSFEAKGVSTKIQLGNTQIMTVDNKEMLSHLPPKPPVPEFLKQDFPGFEIASSYAMVWPGMSAHETGISGLTLHHRKAPNTCDHPFYDLAIRANGDIILCCYDISGRHVMGNIHQDNILELYQSPAYVELRKAMLHKDRETIPDVCKRCSNFTGAAFLRITGKENTL